MIKKNPLVTIGIPTYNRVDLLERSIKSALEQDYRPIEILISDNASTDQTQILCVEYAEKYKAIKYVRQISNIGPTSNFDFVLHSAHGEYFMWLGDDDWIDPGYINTCMNAYGAEPGLSLVAGTPVYYRRGNFDHVGRLFEIVNSSWMLRVIQYYMKVADNGMFYGVMRTSELQETSMPNALGGDWHLIANIISLGKLRLCATVSVHRELGGATSSFRKIVKSLKKPPIQALFPFLTIAFGAFIYLIKAEGAYKRRGFLSRILVATIVFLVITLKSAKSALGGMRRVAAKLLLIHN
jgi:glycosyltransferase involved in cell wall biosynthesis